MDIDTIDNYCAENSIDHIHLLKIDIEGHELDVLSGARECLIQNQSILLLLNSVGAT